MAKDKEATVTQTQIKQEMLELAHDLIEKVKTRSVNTSEIPNIIALFEATKSS